MQQWLSGREPLTKNSFNSSHRAVDPEQTFLAFSGLMPRLGITRLANITGLDRVGIPVFVAVRPQSLGLATSQGKGLDAASARVSALMESIETWHAERVEAVTRYACFGNMRRSAITIDASKLATRSGRIVDDSRPFAWVEARDLLKDQSVWVPWEAVSCDFSSAIVEKAVFAQSTNGLASGNHIEEAILHGLCELIERDAVTLHRHAPSAERDRRRIDLSTLADPRCLFVIERFRAAGLAVAIWDCTSDILVPTFSALVVEEAGQRRPFRGYGCHPSREIALLRALTEAAQSRLTYISGSRDDLFRKHFSALERLGPKVAVGLSRMSGTRPFDAVPQVATARIDLDLDIVLKLVREAGLREIAAFELTRRDVGVPVVKVIVPGLENDLHRSRNYRPGERLQQHLRIDP